MKLKNMYKVTLALILCFLMSGTCIFVHAQHKNDASSLSKESEVYETVKHVDVVDPVVHTVVAKPLSLQRFAKINGTYLQLIDNLKPKEWCQLHVVSIVVLLVTVYGVKEYYLEK